MPLSRLDNFLKNVKGNILYVDPNNLDATDGVENQGNSLARPFKSLQRALIEAARFSYQVGLDNDRFEKTTIYMAPGEYLIDNRPGFIPNGSASYLQRNGLSSTDFPEFSATSDFNLNSKTNDLYKFNSIFGGIIIPRGVSIVGQDLRKCKIKPLYVPDPDNADIERSSIFRLTGATYFFQFSIFDSPKSRGIFKDYTSNTFTGTFSHHKLTVFEFADGANPVNINDEFLTFQSDRTDLDMYYEKVGIAYGNASGRNISPDYPSSGVDIQPRIDEFRIVGPTDGTAGISSIKAGNGNVATTTINVKTSDPIFGLNIDTNVIINNVSDSTYNGTFLVTAVKSATEEGVTEFEYKASEVPGNALPNPLGTTVDLSTDTVSSASPYVFNVSLRSVYGMCGLHADGSKADGFKSMVVAQFTGISLQLDDNAFVKYDTTSGAYQDNTSVENLHTDIDARYKPEYENFHIKASNNSFMQLVSVFGVGYAEHFVTESGGDFSLTNSNSNFGQRALRCDGFRNDSFTQDDYGYISNIIPPQRVEPTENTLSYLPVDVGVTTTVNDQGRLYLYEYKNQSQRPPSIVQGYRVGSKKNEKLSYVTPVLGTPTVFEARIVMPNTAGTSKEVSSVKKNYVGRAGVANSITSSTLTFTENHNILDGETIRVVSDNGRLPNGLNANTVYFAITDGLGADQIRIAQTLNDANAGEEITINNFGGNLTVESRVSDKESGDIGHPIQFDTTENQWYVNVSAASSENNIMPKLQQGVLTLGEAPLSTYISRVQDDRSSIDRIFRARIVIPSSSNTTARPPIPGYVVQESNTVVGLTDNEVQFYFSPSSVSLTNDSQMRNFSFISTAHYDGNSQTATYTTEEPHGLSIGSNVKIENVTSINFPTVGAALSGFNGDYVVSGISSQLTFTVSGVTQDPGNFSNNTSSRTTSLPTYKRTQFDGNYYIYDVNEVSEYINGQQDGIYDTVILSANSQPTVAPFNIPEYSLSQPLRNLYPQINRDNPQSSPSATKSYALPDNIGEVVVDNPENSITAETINDFYTDNSPGIGITDIVTNNSGVGVTIYTAIEHGYNPATLVAVTNAGGGYGRNTGSVEQYWGAKLINTSAGSIGRHATGQVTVDATGQIDSVRIMDGGTAYVEGDNLTIVGIPTFTGFSPCQLRVAEINDQRQDTIQVSGITDRNYSGFNSLFRIVTINGIKEIRVEPVSNVVGIATLGVGVNVLANATQRNVGVTRLVDDFQYDRRVGLGTVTTDNAHGYVTNNAVVLGGSNSDFYNGAFTISEVVGLNTFIVNIGINSVTPAIAGQQRVHPSGFTAQGGDIAGNIEDIGGRSITPYAGITTTINGGINTTTTSVDIDNLERYNLLIGDYLRIDNEIIRVRTTVNNSGGNETITVFRGVMGTTADQHVDGSVVRRVDPYPIELRRNSIIRASGHTFEYIGYGPGNYSTAFPSRQTKTLTPTEQLNAQALNTNGGDTNYTGMNDEGDYYIGKKKVASSGKEVVFETPIQTVVGEDPYSRVNSEKDLGLNYVDSDKITISRSVIVDGGDTNDIISEFNGPVNFSQKITNTSTEGIEANSILLQGNASVSRKITVSTNQPTTAGNPGDIVYNANPTNGGTVGWVYTTNNEWKTFGDISS